MKSMDKLRKRMGVSPVIATVVLVAVTITVAVAVAYWMSGISSQYTSFEKVEIQSAQCVKMPDAGSYYWNITMKLKNTGTAASTLLSVFVNEIEVSAYEVAPYTIAGNLDAAVTNMTEGVTIGSGDTGIVCVYIDTDKYLTLSSGTTINLKIHSAGGMDYIKLVKLT